MARKALDPRRVKLHWPYTVNEIAELFGQHPHTVRRWLQCGLVPVEGAQRPTLVRGKELQRFITAKRAKRRRTCPPGTIFCMKCREPRVPSANLAEVRWLSATAANLIGICPVCDSMMYRRVSSRLLRQVLGKLDVPAAEAERRLSVCP